MKKLIRTTIGIVLTAAVISFLLLSYSKDPVKDTYASEACPDTMPNEQRLTCLQEQAALIQDQRSNVEGSINAENYEQMSLFEQITYLSSTIEDAELEISELEIDIETKTVEISLLGDDIFEIQNNVDTLTQEINVLESSMIQRTKSGYKMAYMSPLEILLDSTDFETLMRKMKYILEAKKKDRNVLADMSISKNHLKNEETLLEEKMSEVQEKRNDIESHRADLTENRKNLESQKGQQQALLAESNRREQEYQQSLEILRAKETAVNQSIAQLVMQMYESGQLGDGSPVNRGDYIGFQGHTGYSYGSHLHFSVSTGSTPYWGYFWGTQDPYSYISSGIPLAGSRVTQGYHQGLAIDLVSTTAGNQLDNTYGTCWQNPTEHQCYYATRGSISCAPSYEGWLSLEGEGAPIRSVAAGKVFYGTESLCGGKYALVIENGTGYGSIYLHLR